MSKESSKTLNSQTLIGYTAKRGHAWHYRAEDQGTESNHYDGPIPVADVERRLFNWEPVVGPVEATILTEDGVLKIHDESRKVVARPDTGRVLGVFKSGYQPHSYKDWLVSNVSTLLDADLKIGSAGLLRNGAWAWVQIEMADTLEACGVFYRPNLLATTSLDGSLTTTYVACNQLVVCDNTCSAALGESGAKKYRVKHSKKSMNKFDEARDALGIVYSMADGFAAEVEKLVNEKVSEERWNAFLTALTAPDPKKKPSTRAANQAGEKRAVLTRLWKHDERVAPWKNTAYGVVAAMNTWAHHEQPTLTLNRVDRNMERMVKGEFDNLDTATLALLATV